MSFIFFSSGICSTTALKKAPIERPFFSVNNSSILYIEYLLSFSIKGNIEDIIFHNSDNGYTVLNIDNKGIYDDAKKIALQNENQKVEKIATQFIELFDKEIKKDNLY